MHDSKRKVMCSRIELKFERHERSQREELCEMYIHTQSAKYIRALMFSTLLTFRVCRDARKEKQICSVEFELLHADYLRDQRTSRVVIHYTNGKR